MQSAYKGDYSAASLRDSIDCMITKRVTKPSAQTNQRLNKKQKFNPFPKNRLNSPEVKRSIKKNFEDYDTGKQSINELKHNLSSQCYVNIDSKEIDKVIKEKNHIDYKTLIKNIQEPSKNANKDIQLHNSTYFSKPEIGRSISPSRSLYQFRKEQEILNNKVGQKVPQNAFNDQDEKKSRNLTRNMVSGNLKRDNYIDELKQIPRQDKQYVKDVQNIFKSQYSESFTFQHTTRPILNHYRKERQEQQLSSINHPQTASKRNLEQQTNLITNDKFLNSAVSRNNVQYENNKKLLQQNNSFCVSAQKPQRIDSQVYYRKYQGEIENLQFNPKEKVYDPKIEQLQQSKSKSTKFFQGSARPYAYDKEENYKVDNYDYLSPRKIIQSPTQQRYLFSSKDNTIQKGI